MNDGPGLSVDELRRRLSDLAESVENDEPWDDPLPHVLRAAEADLETEPRPKPGPFTAVGGRVARIRWPRFSPGPIIAVAAVFLVIALAGIFIHGGGDDSRKSAESSTAGHSAAAAAAAGGGAAAGSTALPGADPRQSSAAGASCESLPASSKLALTAPAELVQRGVISVRVTTSGGTRLSSPTVVVRLRSGAVVGRLVTTVATAVPTASGSTTSFVVTGRLVRTSLSCGDLPGSTIPRPPSPLAAALPAGRYQLVVTGSAGGNRIASAPVVITVHR